MPAETLVGSGRATSFEAAGAAAAGICRARTAPGARVLPPRVSSTVDRSRDRPRVGVCTLDRSESRACPTGATPDLGGGSVARADIATDVAATRGMSIADRGSGLGTDRATDCRASMLNGAAAGTGGATSAASAGAAVAAAAGPAAPSTPCPPTAGVGPFAIGVDADGAGAADATTGGGALPAGAGGETAARAPEAAAPGTGADTGAGACDGATGRGAGWLGRGGSRLRGSR